MALNFRITSHPDGEDLHLSLHGDFDGSSACELLNTIQSNFKEYRTLIIHTTFLDEVHHFGQHLFRRRFSKFIGYHIRILFAGGKADRIAPYHALRSDSTHEAEGTLPAL